MKSVASYRTLENSYIMLISHQLLDIDIMACKDQRENVQILDQFQCV